MNDAGALLLARARAAGARSIAVVGTSKNAGKTVAVAAVCAALQAEGAPFGLCSLGRDGEAFDALEGIAKPRFFLREGTLLATAAVLLPRHPAVEVIELRAERGALGPIVLARVRAPGYFEIAGPASASALRRIAQRLIELAGFGVIDGAVDRIAALRNSDDAIVVSVGATAPTQAHAVDDARALVARLRLPRYDPALPALHVAGALTAEAAAELVRAAERRQVVVADPTQIAIGGRAFLALATQLVLRCERELRPIACTVAPRSPQRAFEPRSFLRAVAAATGLPAYDVYAGEEAA
jgi:hypothetical protein